MKNRDIRQAIKEHGKAQARSMGIPVDAPLKKGVGRPKKHVQTKSKTFRLPVDLIEQIEKEKLENESFTDSIIRLVKLGLLL
tara:strand:+ start:618 stop:863 length:246 start_codon:yes stop_codon:yes gene_type:complete